MSQTDICEERNEASVAAGTLPEKRALPLNSMIRAICASAACPELLYEVMLKAALVIDGEVLTFGLSIWSVKLGRRPEIQWSEGLSSDDLEEGERAVSTALSSQSSAAIAGERTICLALLTPASGLEGVAIYGKSIRPLTESQANTLNTLNAVARLTQSHIELSESRNANNPARIAAAVGSSLPGMIFSSRGMSDVASAVERVKDSESTVLITGESGTGKELVARAIHRLSRRSQNAFVPFNCTAGPSDLIESTLFGHRRGAFTGALEQAGVIRAAEGGTLFLDEVGDLPLSVQPKLLRFLQEGEIHPLGERLPRKVNVRVVAATHKDLELAVREGTFRQDLYYRIAALRVNIPPLRDRPEDIGELISYFLSHYIRRNDRVISGITADAIRVLQNYSWPGNVRELAAEIERLVLYAEEGGVIAVDQISNRILPQQAQPHGHSSSSNLELLLEDFERRVITETLRQHDCNVARTSAALGLGSRQTLYKKLKRLAIDVGEFLNEERQAGMQLRAR
jgi:transcriptional regulator with PAS, ATPase and Fis domain